jgi:hypothetical protein
VDVDVVVVEEEADEIVSFTKREVKHQGDEEEEII